MFPMRKEVFTAYVVFSGADHSIWWRLFTRRGFRHVQMIIPASQNTSLLSRDGRCILVNAMSFGVSIAIVDKSASEIVADCKQAGVTQVLAYPVKKYFKREFVPRGVLTCVSLLKAVMEINAWWVITPEQLARWLLKNGAKEV